MEINRFSFGVYFREIDGEPYSSFYLNIIDTLAEFEHSLIPERTKEGLKRAKSQGKQLEVKTKTNAVKVAIFFVKQAKENYKMKIGFCRINLTSI